MKINAKFIVYRFTNNYFCLQTPLSELKLPLKLKWRSEKDMPWATWGCQQVVVFREKVYIRGGDASSDRETQTCT